MSDRQYLESALERYYAARCACPPNEYPIPTADTEAALIRIVLDLQEKVQNMEATIALLCVSGDNFIDEIDGKYIDE